MARWIPRQERVFELPSTASNTAIMRARIRLDLVERGGLMRGLFNVREQREAPAQGHTADPIARMLSWRWLKEQDAARLLADRERTLTALGYAAIEHHPLRTRPSPVQTRPAQPSLDTSLASVGTSFEAVLDTLARRMGVPAHTLADPTHESVRALPPSDVASLIPFLLHHHNPHLRDMGQRFLALPITRYHVPVATLEQWLATNSEIARQLAPCLEDEGLALLGETALRRLAQRAPQAVREPCAHWAERCRT